MKKEFIIASGVMICVTGLYCYLLNGNLEEAPSDLSISDASVTLVQSANIEEVGINYQEGYLKEDCSIKLTPNSESEIIDYKGFNQKVEWCDYLEDTNWCIINMNGWLGYVEKRYISLEELPYTIIKIPEYSGFKSWEDYRCITLTNSKQYKLQQCADTNEYGIREVDGRYCIAVGNGVGCEIGDYVDLILGNGTIIPCIIGDIKDNSDTDSSNLITTHSDCCSEFIVYSPELYSSAKSSGNMSKIIDDWDSRVVEIRRYKKNYFRSSNNEN